MQLGIIGLPKSGKTTVFNALTRGKAETAAYSTGKTALNLGIVKVPDHRLEFLTRMFNPKRTVPASIEYIDIGTDPRDPGKGEGIAGEFLSHISRADALIHVVRVFNDENLPHIAGTVNAKRDIATMEMELAFSDMAIIERRIKRIEDNLKAVKAQERDTALRESSLLERIKVALEDGIPIREQELSAHDLREVSTYQFLTAKPLLVILNIGEGQLEGAEQLEMQFRDLHQHPTYDVVTLCGKLEMELAQLADDEAQLFREDMNIKEAGLNRAIALSYRLLGFISFFTVGSDEVKAWTIQGGTVAQKAAGKIHSDMDRGFIRAEVIAYDDLVKCGSIADARHKGLMRIEGKSYVIQDGDIMTVLFNI